MNKLFVFLICVLAALDLHGQTNPPPRRLAIVPETPEAEAAADLLTAEFSKNEQVHLLERVEIGKVYREQALSAGNMQYLKLGQVLGADGLLLLEPVKEGSNQFLNVRLVAVRPGVVLVAETFPWPLKNGMEWSAAFARHLDLFLPKLTVLVKDAIPLSVVNLRSSIASAQTTETERQLKLLAVQRLSREKQLFVLERQKMQSLSEENRLQGIDDSNFWNGSYLLEGIIDRDGYSADRMTINARLTPPNGGAPMQFELSASRTNLYAAVNDLARKVIEALNLQSSATAWSAADEADEFFAEAKWAHRWGSFAEAQAASEAAWAMGKRSKDLALLRIQSYAGSIATINDWSGNISIPAFPEADKLPALIRALELFSQDAPLMFTNPAVVDKKCFSEGVRIFREAGSLLDGFYQAAELRAGNEGQLAELRRLARQTWLILETKAPLLLERSPPPWTSNSKDVFSSEVHHQLEMYDLAKWEEGGVFFDRPEDALPMFRQMLETGYIPTELPRIIGWNWKDRKRVPQVSRQFIADLCASTNPAVRLGGLCLSLAQTQFYPEAIFHEREESLLGAIWNYRDWVFCQADHARIVQQTEEILRDRYRESDGNVYFGREPFASLRHNLRKAYLTTQTNFDSQVVEALFYRGFATVSPAEAHELIPLIENSSLTNRDLLRRSEEYRRMAGVPPRSVVTIIPKPVLPAEDPLVVKFTSWNGEAFKGTSYSQPQVQRIIVRGHRLWMQIKYLKPNQFTPYDSSSVFAAIDLQSGESQSIPFPEKDGFPDRGFEVSQDSLYVSVQSRLQRYHFRGKNWASVPVPMTGGAEIVELNGALYLSTADSLLEMAPDSGTVQILASSRRQPPANELDSSLNDGPHEIFRAGGQLGLAMGNQMFVFTPTNRTWRHLPQLPMRAGWTQKTYSDRGALLLAAGFSYFSYQRLFEIAIDATASELLLEKYNNLGSTNRMAGSKPAQPRWDWPAAFQLASSCLAADGQSLWILHARKIRMSFFETEEPVIFQDDRQATLLHFEPGHPQPLMVPIHFDKDGQSTDPFDLNQLGFMPPTQVPRPFWLATPEGLVVSCPNLMGHWLIPGTELEKRLTNLRLIAQKVSGAGSNSLPVERSRP